MTNNNNNNNQQADKVKNMLDSLKTEYDQMQKEQRQKAHIQESYAKRRAKTCNNGE